MALTRRIATLFRHEQPTAAAVWTIVHGLNDYPIVDVYVDFQNEIHKIIPGSVTYTNANTVTVTFTTPFSGYATVC
jgi:hypothetical protein